MHTKSIFLCVKSGLQLLITGVSKRVCQLSPYLLVTQYASSVLVLNSGVFVIFQGPIVVKIQSLGDPPNNIVDELAEEDVDPSQGVQDILGTLVKDHGEGNGTFQRFHVASDSVIDFWPSIWNWTWEQMANHTPKFDWIKSLLSMLSANPRKGLQCTRSNAR